MWAIVFQFRYANIVSIFHRASYAVKLVLPRQSLILRWQFVLPNKHVVYSKIGTSVEILYNLHTHTHTRGWQQQNNCVINYANESKEYGICMVITCRGHNNGTVCIRKPTHLLWYCTVCKCRKIVRRRWRKRINNILMHHTKCIQKNNTQRFWVDLSANASKLYARCYTMRCTRVYAITKLICDDKSQNNDLFWTVARWQNNHMLRALIYTYIPNCAICVLS